MGQKINPVGFRLSVNRNWGSKWFANTKNFPAMPHPILQAPFPDPSPRLPVHPL